MSEFDEIKPVPCDGNDRHLITHISELGTSRVTSIGVGGTAITVDCDIKWVLIVPDAAGELTIVGTMDDYDSDACPVPVGLAPIPLVAKADTTIFTLKAVSGTKNCTLLFGR